MYCEITCHAINDEAAEKGTIHNRRTILLMKSVPRSMNTTTNGSLKGQIGLEKIGTSMLSCSS
jgi:hypothetical protein